MAEGLLIDIRNISKSYAADGVRTEVLKNVSLAVHDGEMLAVVGASGSGKSTLMNILGLLDHPDEGEYWLKHRQINTLSEDERATWRNQYIGFVFQQFHLLPRFNAKQNVALPLSYRQLPSRHIDQQVANALAKVGMEGFAHRKPTQLSGGQQQRVAIARALVGSPHVILADEPTGSLDSKTGKEVMTLFHSLHQEGRTIIIVTHDEQVARQCDRRIILVDGQVVSQ